jgi:hypothetical protein
MNWQISCKGLVIPTEAHRLLLPNSVIPTGAERSERSGGTCCFFEPSSTAGYAIVTPSAALRTLA